MRRGELQVLVIVLAVCIKGYFAEDVTAEKRTVPKFNPYKVKIAPSDCFDRSDDCEMEESKGFCISNFKYMAERCPLACRLCKKEGGDIKECKDQEDKCKAWSKRGDCTLYSDFMAQNCKKSCEMCEKDGDEDLDTVCPTWAKKGYCYIHPLHLGLKCRHSCNKYRKVRPRYFYPPTMIPGGFIAATKPKPPSPPKPPKPVIVKKEKTEAEKLKEKNDAELARELEEQDKEEELEERAEAWKEREEQERQLKAYTHILTPLQDKTYNATSGTLNKIEGPPVVPLQDQPPAPEPMSPEEVKKAFAEAEKAKQLKRAMEAKKAKKRHQKHHKRHHKHHHKRHHKHHSH